MFNDFFFTTVYSHSHGRGFSHFFDVFIFLFPVYLQLYIMRVLFAALHGVG